LALTQERTVLSYISEDELEKLRAMSLGQRIRFLRERMDEIFEKEYSIKKVAKRITERGVSITPIALYQLEGDQIYSPKSLFLMGVAQELGVSMEFLLQGPPKEDDQKALEYGLKALQKLDEQDRQTIMKILKRFLISKDIEESDFP
jgi:transcriptional regulator with XRE-family HTH domain